MSSALNHIASVKQALSNNGTDNRGSKGSFYPNLTSACVGTFFKPTAPGCDLLLGHHFGCRLR